MQDKFYNWRYEHIGNFLNKSLCRYLIKLIKPFFDEDFLIEGYNLEIRDCGKCVSPRYNLRCRISNNSWQESGLYGAFALDSEEEAEAFKRFEKRESLYTWLARNIFRFYWRPEIKPVVLFWKECEWNKKGEYIGERSEENTENPEQASDSVGTKS